MTALAIQRAFLDVISPAVTRVENAQAHRALALWRQVLDALEQWRHDGAGPAAQMVEWVAKYELCEGLRRRSGTGWDDPRLAALDIQWADLRPGRSVIDKLDAEFKSGLEGLPHKNIVVSHEAFGYLCDDYGLTQLPIEGIEADAEPDAQQMAKITDFVKQNGVTTIFSEELVSPKVAQSIADATGASVEELNPLEGLSEEELASGDDYFSTMRENLDKLKKALA